MTLNSIMFLLIQITGQYYDKTTGMTLNSIMFLLIQVQFLQMHSMLIALNSIMFLLILMKLLNVDNVDDTFKFHYVSINSCM